MWCGLISLIRKGMFTHGKQEVMQDSIGLKVNFHMIRAKYRSLRRYDAPSGRGTSVLTGLLGKVLRLGTMVGGFVLSWSQNEEEGMNERGSKENILGFGFEPCVTCYFGFDKCYYIVFFCSHN